MEYTNWIKNNPAGSAYLHWDYDYDYNWGTKDDTNDKDNGFVCKKAIEWKKRERERNFSRP